MPILRTLNIDVAKLEERIVELKREHGDKVKAVMPVHIGGQACEMDKIVALAGHHHLAIVEDAAHAFPTTAESASVTASERKARMVGSIGTRDRVQLLCHQDHRHRRRRHADHGRRPDGGAGPPDAAARRPARTPGIAAPRRCHRGITKSLPGLQIQSHDVASALGMVQLQRGQELLDRRVAIARRYNAAFAGQVGLEPPVLRHPDDVCAWHLYIVRLNLDQLTIDRDQFTRELDARGVGCSVHFIPLHLQPYWRDRYKADAIDAAGGERRVPARGFVANLSRYERGDGSAGD